MRPISPHLLFGAAALLFSSAALDAKPDSQARAVVSLAAQPSLTTNAVKLRGYGKVESALWNQESGTVLKITCESEEKAKLMQAKYLSDIALLPGVKKVTDQSGTRYEVQSQGIIACYCQGANVAILAAKSEAAWKSLLKKAKPSGVSSAQVKVPMYLDRWDKYAFRHYYRPWEKPPGKSADAYDFTQEFDYAKAQDDAGILVFQKLMAADTAEGMCNSGWYDWVAEEAGKRNLPIDLHIEAGLGVPTWLLNRYRDQTQMKMPGFTGNFHSIMSPVLGGQGEASWSSTTLKDTSLGLLQAQVRRFAKMPNTVSVLEPHGELYHGAQDHLLEYGPLADASFRRYLKSRYDTPERVAARWRLPLKSWDDVRVPELASFAGWGTQALDVGGQWRVGYEELLEPAWPGYAYQTALAKKSKPAPEEWFREDFDDSQWPEVAGAGNDQQMFLNKRPAVFRRHFDVPAEWKSKNGRVWLYVWDMNTATKEEVRVALNGTVVDRSKVLHAFPHWCAAEVTDVLKAGRNTLALRLPQGFVAYKTYLSPTAPAQYPNLGDGLNTQWTDFVDFNTWTRLQAVQRGVEMIRQAAPDLPITLMHPDEYSDGIKAVATAYGAEFHNTGYMGAFWADYNASLMRGADMPFSLEPGGPADTLQKWKLQWGLWQTEGVQSVDYFIHLGNILWNPEIKADYEVRRKQFTLMGQSHYAKAEVACLYSDRVLLLTGFPWGAGPNTMVGGGYWKWNPGSVLRGVYPYDGLTESSFASGDASAYRVIVDSNSTIMDEPMVTEIENWVRAGGTFVTLAQTGRHTSEKGDAWPIARLTGYKVTKIDRLNPDGSVDERGALQAAPDQTVFDSSWNGTEANGLHMEKVAEDARNLLMWNDGTVAAGVRPLGKGYIVQLGAKFTGIKIGDRVEPGNQSKEPRQLRKLLTAVLEWRGVRREPGKLHQQNDSVWLRPAVTNNGLYDTWTIWNQSGKQSEAVSVELDKKPAFAFDGRDGNEVAVTTGQDGAQLENLVIEPMDTRVFLTPRGEIEKAPQAWFDLQCKWWKGTAVPEPRTLPQSSEHLARNLTPDWKFKAIGIAEDAAVMLQADFDDSQWGSRTLGIWNVKDTEGKGHGVFRKQFTVPKEWNAGRVSLWMTSWYGASFVGSGRVWLDGREVKPLNEQPYIAIGLPSLQAGTSHTLAVEVQGPGVLLGLRGNCWMSYEPEAAKKIDLAGEWSPSADGLRYEAPVTLPGKYDTQFLRRKATVPAEYRGLTAAMTVDGDPALVGVLINGKLVRRHHHMIGGRWSLNLTPFVRFGEENEIQVVRWEQKGAGFVREINLGFFKPGVFSAPESEAP